MRSHASDSGARARATGASLGLASIQRKRLANSGRPLRVLFGRRPSRSRLSGVCVKHLGELARGWPLSGGDRTCLHPCRTPCVSRLCRHDTHVVESRCLLILHPCAVSALRTRKGTVFPVEHRDAAAHCGRHAKSAHRRRCGSSLAMRSGRWKDVRLSCWRAGCMLACLSPCLAASLSVSV